MDDQKLLDTENRVTTRYNNLDGNAQARSNEAFESNKTGPTNINEQSLEERASNVALRESTVADEEANTATTFKNNDLQIKPNENISPEGDIFGRVAPVKNPDTFESEPTAPTAPTAPTQPSADLSPKIEDTLSSTAPVEDDVASSAAKTAASTAKDAAEAGGKKLFEKELVSGAGLDWDPLALIGELIVGAATTLPSILKKQKKQPVQMTLNPSSGLGVTEVS